MVFRLTNTISYKLAGSAKHLRGGSRRRAGRLEPQTLPVVAKGVPFPVLRSKMAGFLPPVPMQQWPAAQPRTARNAGAVVLLYAPRHRHGPVLVTLQRAVFYGGLRHDEPTALICLARALGFDPETLGLNPGGWTDARGATRMTADIAGERANVAIVSGLCGNFEQGTCRWQETEFMLATHGMAIDLDLLRTFET